jgi:hypothetical protein
MFVAQYLDWVGISSAGKVYIYGLYLWVIAVVEPQLPGAPHRKQGRNLHLNPCVTSARKSPRPPDD